MPRRFYFFRVLFLLALYIMAGIFACFLLKFSFPWSITENVAKIISIPRFISIPYIIAMFVFLTREAVLLITDPGRALDWEPEQEDVE